MIFLGYKSFREEVKEAGINKGYTRLVSPSPSLPDFSRRFGDTNSRINNQSNNSFKMDMSNDVVSDFSANSEMGQIRLNKIMMTNRELSVISDYEQIQANPALSAFQANMSEGNDRKMSMRDLEDLSKAAKTMEKA